ncbi:hypothetical protein E1295_01525 [Nonomuraea mesophila]|uniref:WXG100 family type VII secretion target n=1 Tax=Nonomuraea mesophila TaxID=2530382 RepID=A0A4V2ZBU6_9ACTN|nr:hypothetical protein [Nonomuraea mesophila]TDE59957.1 hypothetical protein E1295_01525 [Nonomuraea mesophila]
MAERSVTVRDSSVRPTEVCIAAKREQILAWLEDTSPVEVHDRGMTYAKVAENIRSLADALPEVGTALNGAWRAGSAAKTQEALRKLQASGSRLATAMQDMSDALTLYGRDYLPQAIEEARKDATGDQGDDGPARLALEKLNRRIISLYENKVPETVSVDLPEVSPAGAPDTTRRMPLDTRSPYRQGDYWNGGGSDPGASNGSGPYGGTGSHAGTGTSGNNAGSDSGSDGGRDSGGNDGGNDGTGDDPAAESPASPGDRSGSTGDQNGQSPTEQNPGDGTAPAVIDNNTTDTPGDTRDPGSTESANAPVQHPPTTQLPVTQQPVGAQPPGTPAVIGGGGSYTQAAAVGSVSARPAIGGMGMPFIPMGGGAAGGEQSQDQERSTYLTEDRDMWHPGERSTSPVIGA